MSKILMVIGGRAKGNSYLLASLLSNELFKFYPNWDSKIIQLTNCVINSCDGCLTCDGTHRCHFEDDMEEILENVREATLLVLITPARWGLLSGQMKTFIDRLNPMAITEELVGKKGLAIAIGQSEVGDESIKNARESIEKFFSSACVDYANGFEISGCLKVEDLLQSEILKSYLEMGITAIRHALEDC